MQGGYRISRCRGTWRVLLACSFGRFEPPAFVCRSCCSHLVFGPFGQTLILKFGAVGRSSKKGFLLPIGPVESTSFRWRTRDFALWTSSQSAWAPVGSKSGLVSAPGCSGCPFLSFLLSPEADKTDTEHCQELRVLKCLE